MRILAGVLALAVGCGSQTYVIPRGELARLATIAPEQRGQSVRVVEQLHDAAASPVPVVRAETEIVVFPDETVYGPERRRYYGYGPNLSTGSGGGGSFGSVPRSSGGGGGGGMHLGGGGDGKGAAIALLVIAATVLVAAAIVEGTRYDGFAQLHPMQPVHLLGKDGGYMVLPLAWIDPQTVEWTDKAFIRQNEGPFRGLGRAPLDRAGWTYALYGGIGTFKSVDGTKAQGTATTIQLGYFPDQKWGIVGSAFFGWRDDTAGAVLFESRYTAELSAFPLQAGPVHFGLYGGAGGAYRLEDVPGGNSGGLALIGGAQIQLDINTRLALTARLGQTYAHDERMSDALFGLAVY